MIGRTLAKRVQKLEARLIPSSEPMVIQIRYVSPDGSVRLGPKYGLSEGASAHPPYKRPRTRVPGADR